MSRCLISDFLHSFMKIGFSHQNSGEARYVIIWHLQNSVRTYTSPLGSGAASRYGEYVESTFVDETVLSTSVGIAEFSSGLTSKTTQGQSLNGKGPLFIFYIDEVRTHSSLVEMLLSVEIERSYEKGDEMRFPPKVNVLHIRTHLLM